MSVLEDARIHREREGDLHSFLVQALLFLRAESKAVEVQAAVGQQAVCYQHQAPCSAPKEPVPLCGSLSPPLSTVSAGCSLHPCGMLPCSGAFPVEWALQRVKEERGAGGGYDSLAQSEVLNGLRHTHAHTHAQHTGWE